jgi:hypothetical protein
VTTAALARALSDHPDDRDTHPRALVRAWQEQQRTVSPANAARVGEALRTIGVPWSSAAVALYASRHYESFLTELRTLASTVDVEYACGVFIYAQIVVEYDLYGGYPFAVKVAPRTKSFRPDAERDMATIARLPRIVARVRESLAGAHRAVQEPTNKQHLCVAAESPGAKMAIARYLEPALQLLRSNAPPRIAWEVIVPLLEHWLHGSLPTATHDGIASEMLWGASTLYAKLSDGTPISGSILFEDGDVLKALPIAESTERYRGSRLETELFGDNASASITERSSAPR